MRAKDYPKLHHPDPLGFWKLVRIGEELPAVGQRILYVHDIRGTNDELHHNLMVRIAEGDPYRCGIVAQKKPGDKVQQHEAMIDELLKLPTKQYQPETRVGVVDEVAFDEVLGEWYISVRTERGWPGFSVNPDHIVYWAPFPSPPNTYTERPDDFEHLSFEGQRTREVNIRDYLESRKHRKRGPT